MTPKRTMGQCSEECIRHRYASAMNGACGHLASCPTLYPLQRQPGDEQDALTRLVTKIRVGWRTDGSDGGEEGWEAQCLDLVSEAREEHRRLQGAARQAAQVSLDDLEKARAEMDVLRHDLAKATDALLATHKRMGEVRQRNLDEGREQGHLDAFLWLRAHHKGTLAPTAEDMRVALAEMMDGK